MNGYIGEAGFSYGPAKSEGLGRILRVDRYGMITEVARDFRAPMTGVKYKQGCLYVAEGAYPGSIVRLSSDGKKETLVTGLMSGGDHYAGDIVFDANQKMYFGVGTFTNSAVVGLDNFLGGWLPDLPNAHDVPARNYVLRGINFESPDPFALVMGKVVMVKTGAFKPFGTPSSPGEVIPAQFFANGVIYESDLDGKNVRVFADGLRNPFGLGVSPGSKLFAIDLGYDNRGSRSVENAPDSLWEIKYGTWYGWPDYVGGEPITNPRFKPPGKPQPEFVLAEHPQIPPCPLVKFQPHSSTMKFDFSINPLFGYTGDMFVAQFGSAPPVTGLPTGIPGYKVARVDLATCHVNNFLVINNPGPGGTGPARPVDAKFDPTGNCLYVVDFGILEANASGIIPWANSGALWRIRRA